MLISSCNSPVLVTCQSMACSDKWHIGQDHITICDCALARHSKVQRLIAEVRLMAVNPSLFQSNACMLDAQHSRLPPEPPPPKP